MNPRLNQTPPTGSGSTSQEWSRKVAASIEAGLLLYAAQVQVAYAVLLRLVWHK